VRGARPAGRRGASSPGGHLASRPSELDGAERPPAGRYDFAITRLVEWISPGPAAWMGPSGAAANPLEVSGRTVAQTHTVDQFIGGRLHWRRPSLWAKHGPRGSVRPHLERQYGAQCSAHRAHTVGGVLYTVCGAQSVHTVCALRRLCAGGPAAASLFARSLECLRQARVASAHAPSRLHVNWRRRRRAARVARHRRQARLDGRPSLGGRPAGETGAKKWAALGGANQAGVGRLMQLDRILLANGAELAAWLVPPACPAGRDADTGRPFARRPASGACSFPTLQAGAQQGARTSARFEWRPNGN